MILQKTFLALGFVVLALSVYPWSSQAQVPTDFGDALRILLQEQVISLDDRKVVARGFEVECGKLSEKIPELSPRENDWVDAEIKAGRIDTIAVTVELAKRTSRRTLVACHQWARLLAGDRAEDSESYLWSEFLGVILDEYLADRVRRIKTSNAASITDKDIGFVEMFPTAARFITRKILIPSLRRTAAQKK